MGQLHILLRHDFPGLGKKGSIVSKENFDAFVREQNDVVARFLKTTSKKVTMQEETRYISTFTVRVSGFAGVIDMMRYDSCYPATEVESRKLERISSGSDKAEDHVVTFIRAGRNDSGPTIRRWASFNCKVLEVEVGDG